MTDTERVAARGYLESPDGTRWVRQDHATKLITTERRAIIRMVKKEQAKYLRCSEPRLAFAYAEKVDMCATIVNALEARSKAK